MEPRTNTTLRSALHGERWRKEMLTIASVHCSVPGKHPLPGIAVAPVYHFSRGQCSCFHTNVCKFISWVSAHVGRNRELCLSTHGHLPGHYSKYTYTCICTLNYSTDCMLNTLLDNRHTLVHVNSTFNKNWYLHCNQDRRLLTRLEPWGRSAPNWSKI